LNSTTGFKKVSKSRKSANSKNRRSRKTSTCSVATKKSHIRRTAKSTAPKRKKRLIPKKVRCKKNLSEKVMVDTHDEGYQQRYKKVRKAWKKQSYRQK
jgi:hypothetical protein